MSLYANEAKKWSKENAMIYSGHGNWNAKKSARSSSLGKKKKESSSIGMAINEENNHHLPVQVKLCSSVLTSLGLFCVTNEKLWFRNFNGTGDPSYKPYHEYDGIQEGYNPYYFGDPEDPTGVVGDFVRIPIPEDIRVEKVFVSGERMGTICIFDVNGSIWVLKTELRVPLARLRELGLDIVVLLHDAKIHGKAIDLQVFRTQVIEGPPDSAILLARILTEKNIILRQVEYPLPDVEYPLSDVNSFRRKYLYYDDEDSSSSSEDPRYPINRDEEYEPWYPVEENFYVPSDTELYKKGEGTIMDNMGTVAFIYNEHPLSFLALKDGTLSLFPPNEATLEIIAEQENNLKKLVESSSKIQIITCGWTLGQGKKIQIRSCFNVKNYEEKPAYNIGWFRHFTYHSFDDFSYEIKQMYCVSDHFADLVCVLANNQKIYTSYTTESTGDTKNSLSEIRFSDKVLMQYFSGVVPKIESIFPFFVEALRPILYAMLIVQVEGGDVFTISLEENAVTDDHSMVFDEMNFKSTSDSSSSLIGNVFSDDKNSTPLHYCCGLKETSFSGISYGCPNCHD